MANPLRIFAAYDPVRGERRRVSSLVRAAVHRDVEACVDIMRAAGPGDEGARRARLDAAVEDHSEGFFVVEVEGDVRGFGRVQWLTRPIEAPADTVPEGWYLVGAVVAPQWRRQGVGDALTAARLEWVWLRAEEAWYFANVRNRVSIDLHAKHGFVEVTNDFCVPNVTFDSGRGTGALFRCNRRAAPNT